MINKGLITDKQKEDLKEAYPKDALFKWTTPDKKDDLVLRAISSELMAGIVDIIRESEMAGRNLPIQEVNDTIFDNCVVWPVFSAEERENLPIGIIPSVVKTIQEKSGFIDIDIFQRVLAPDTFTTILKDFDYWPDITEDESKALKEASKPFSLYRVRISKWVFVIRPMTRVDIQVATQATDEQSTIAKSITMWPKDVEWENIPAGIVEILARKGNDISGWSADTDSDVEEL